VKKLLFVFILMGLISGATLGEELKNEKYSSDEIVVKFKQSGEKQLDNLKYEIKEVKPLFKDFKKNRQKIKIISQKK